MVGMVSAELRTLLDSVVGIVALAFRTRVSMQLEILALRHRPTVYQRSEAKPRLKPADRLLWAWLSRMWAGWQAVLVFVEPATVIAWQRRRFREHWAALCGTRRPGHPTAAPQVRELIRRMSEANPTWGAPRIVGEPRKLGIDVPKSTVEQHMVRQRKPPSPTWRAFLKNHVRDLVSIDFFVVPTVRFEVLFVLGILAHYRRRIAHVNVTEYPTAEWREQEVMEAFPWDEAPT